MDYLTKWPEAYDIPSQKASTVAEAIVTISAASEFRGSYIVTREVTSLLV
jgi:hypothetical protein